ncbi:prepilin-type N-terminal cleavage/methylation domain-containing protein [uncultured Clostridium sp.]|uniref:prepilin-type N-terminal cleavage/methylation domain-containing protein n=1 Tax=uncultured Clostridium sp. TaxID=59620 RepID=UPI0026049D1B|nr:prepilin-type N-terminal cleavage/methylation domain-containing protein [uncultured Clostridium sp.]
MKKGYTLIELIIVLAIISILILPSINISKSYSESIMRIKGKSIANEIGNLISYGKYYCRYYDILGLIEINKEEGKIVFKDISGRTKIIKTILLEDGFKFVTNDTFSISKLGSIQKSDTIRVIDKNGKLYKVTISTGIGSVNIYEGD